MNGSSESGALPVAAKPQHDAMLSGLERAASNPDVSPEKMMQLLDVHERILNRNAESAFHAAMTLAQQEMRVVATDASNPQTHSKYASFAALDRALRPIYTKHGFGLSFDTGDAPQPELMRLLCYVSHRDGHCKTYKIDVPIDGKGAKGGDVMTKTHATGAGASYGMRYLLKMIWNVAVGEDDKDGNKVKGNVERITEKQAADLSALIDELKGDAKALLKHLKYSKIEDIPAQAYSDVVALVKKKWGSK